MADVGARHRVPLSSGTSRGRREEQQLDLDPPRNRS